jgi:hypothetical protein
MMTNVNAVVAIYKSRAEAETAVKELQQSGFDMKKLSIAGRDHHTNEHLVPSQNAVARMKHLGKLGISWDGIGGWLFGSGLFLVPGVDPLFVAGPLVAWIVGGLEGAVVAGALRAQGAGLYSVDNARDCILRYEAALKSGKLVVIAHSSVQEAIRVWQIIGRVSPEMLEERQMLFENEEQDIAGAVVVGVGGLGTVGAGLCSLGVAEDSVPRYEMALKSGKFVMVAHGHTEEATRARDIISRVNPEMLEQHQPRVNRPNLVANNFRGAG